MKLDGRHRGWESKNRADWLGGRRYEKKKRSFVHNWQREEGKKKENGNAKAIKKGHFSVGKNAGGEGKGHPGEIGGHKGKNRVDEKGQGEVGMEGFRDGGRGKKWGKAKVKSVDGGQTTGKRWGLGSTWWATRGGRNYNQKFRKDYSRIGRNKINRRSEGGRGKIKERPIGETLESDVKGYAVRGTGGRKKRL